MPPPPSTSEVPFFPTLRQPSAIQRAKERRWLTVRLVRDDKRACPFHIERRWWWWPFWTEVDAFTHLDNALERFDELGKPTVKPVVIVIKEK